ncbi:MAG: hypothetical protein WBG90_21680 [Saonia sp.]
MKKIIVAIALLSTLAFTIGCTNDEGDNDIDVINPTDDESSKYKAEELTVKP